MAQLNSPGVSVTVIDESFYLPAAPGTVPLIIVASAENKPNGSNTGIAPGTLTTDAGNVHILTSQKDLVDQYGTPIFQTDASNNPIHAGELNEYGLQTAYSYLGVSNQAYVIRADIDLSELTAAATAPTGQPHNGTFWFDVADTDFGIFEWNSGPATATNGQTFTNKVPLVITDTAQVDLGTGGPLVSVGAIGDYSVVATSTLNTLWFKKGETGNVTYPSGTWVETGTPQWAASWPAATGTISSSSVILATGDHFIITVNGVASDITAVTTLIELCNAINGTALLITDGITAALINNCLVIYSTGNDFTLSGTAVALAGLSSSTYLAPAVQLSAHTLIPLYKRADNSGTAVGVPSGAIWIKTTVPNLGANWIVKKFSATTNLWAGIPAPLYASSAAALAGLDSTGGGYNLPLGSLFVKYNDSEMTPPLVDFKLYARQSSGATTITSAIVTNNTFTSGTYSFYLTETVSAAATLAPYVLVSFTAIANGVADASAFVTALGIALNTNNVTSVRASVNASNQIVISHIHGGDIKFTDHVGTPIIKLFSTTKTFNFGYDSAVNASYYPITSANYIASSWTSTVGGTAFAPASEHAPTTTPVAGTLWYDSLIDEVDIMINNGTTWVAYRNATLTTDENGPIISASQPTTQSTGQSLVTNDLWIDTSDLEHYPLMYRYNTDVSKWILIDVTDQTTENGIVFADARWNTTGTTATASTIIELLGGTGDIGLDGAANFLDPDAPEPLLYPKGMLLWNLRRSGFNVKKYVENYINTQDINYNMNAPIGEAMTSYYPNRWVSDAPNLSNGAGAFGRKSQRQVILTALKKTVNSNLQIRDEEGRIFNLIVCPGYPELMSEMIGLNTDRGLTAFVIGDCPARLASDATSLSNWGLNAAGALEDGDVGLVSFDDYTGVFYPWGYTSDNLGNNIAVPPSHMMLRTIALSDNVSYPWFAPAGTRRGTITNASAVGYITREGEFQAVSLSTGQRDVLQQICKINPITFFTGMGLLNYGQLTRANVASALDRINVARLIIYLRGQLARLAKPFIFEPNDTITRNELKGVVEGLLLELVGQRALYDYVVVCDTSNNTPTTIDANELYVDIAIEPVKAVEFIYIPLRLENTGGIAKMGAK